MTDDIETLIRAASQSLAVTWGTTAPYAIGRVSGERVGYAQDPCVVLNVWCRDQDMSALVPIVRQRVSRELAERGWSLDDIEITPGVQSNRRRRFTDENESSDSHGRAKMGTEHRFRFGMRPGLATATFQGFGNFKPLPDHPSRLEDA